MFYKQNISFVLRVCFGSYMYCLLPAELPLDHPLHPYQDYYTQAESSVPALVQIRWRTFLQNFIIDFISMFALISDVYMMSKMSKNWFLLMLLLYVYFIFIVFAIVLVFLAHNNNDRKQ